VKPRRQNRKKRNSKWGERDQLREDPLCDRPPALLTLVRYADIGASLRDYLTTTKLETYR
jgi:hypothetical protein